PSVNLSPSSLTFTSQLVGTTSTTQTVTVSNPGTATLNIASITVLGDYSQTSTCGATLGVGANCTITVAFLPTTQGARAGVITITDNAAGSPHNIALNGIAVIPDFTLTSSAGSVVVQPSVSGTVTMSTAALNGFSGPIALAVSGIPSGAFA